MVHSVSAASRRAVLAATAAAAGMIVPTAQAYSEWINCLSQHVQQYQKRNELLKVAQQFPGGMIGVSDDASYDLSDFRPWITRKGALQTDYGALTDLRFSGVSDMPLALAFRDCRLPYIYMGKSGVPFTLRSTYTGMPLFSDAVREQFAAHYTRVATLRWFNVYACQSSIAHR
jgi:hypothetical protein